MPNDFVEAYYLGYGDCIEHLLRARSTGLNDETAIRIVIEVFQKHKPQEKPAHDPSYTKN